MTRHAVFGLLFLLLLQSVTAVGLGNMPANREVIFTPFGHTELSFAVLNGAHIDVGISSLVTGDPATLGTPQDNNMLEYVSLNDPAPNTGQRTVGIVFDFPEQMQPGVYPLDIHVTDRPPHQDRAMVTAIASVKLRLIVHVLSPEKFLEVSTPYVPPIAEGLDANATITVVSRTTSVIDDVYAEVYVYKDDILTQSTTNHLTLASAATGTLFAVLDTASLEGGEYDVNATVQYDGHTRTTSTTTLKIGTLHVGVPTHTETFTYNTTNKFEFTISNQWNRELQDVFASVQLGGQQKKTASHNIPPFGRTAYEVYFDRDETLEGTIPVNITITYKDFDPKTRTYITKTESIIVSVHVLLPPLEETPMQIRTFIALFMGIIVILLLLIVMLILLKRTPEHHE